MKIESYELKVIYDEGPRGYLGELWINGKLSQQTSHFQSEGMAALRLNKRIEAFNNVNGTKIPLYKKDAPTNKSKPKAGQSPEPAETSQSEEKLKKPTKPTAPRRKPFTPYGLKGYFVDKQGNIRLHLDRRANANTIVLNPDMFAMLADMVKATQEQQNDTQIS